MSKIKTITNEIILKGRQNNYAWFTPKLAAIPSADPNLPPQIHLSVVHLLGNDIGIGMFSHTEDLGNTWTCPAMSLNLDKIPCDDDIFESAGLGSSMSFYSHQKTHTLFGLGQTVFSQDQNLDPGFKSEILRLDSPWREHRCPCYGVWDLNRQDFKSWRKLPLPESMTHLGQIVIPGCSDIVEQKDGTLLIPYNHSDGKTPFKVGTFKCSFDGKTLTILETGQTVGDDRPGGICEPSMIQFGDQFFMTIRSQYGDFRMYHAQSDDGLNWNRFEPWCWDDGEPVETENTQQHWLKQGDSLYLIYTRRNELSNGVFRNRAPIFIAKVDPEKMQLIRESEQIVFPEKGARMGNFCVLNISDRESWIVTGEWLEQRVAGYDANQRFYCQIESNGVMYNRIQFIGDLLLARVYFD